MEHFFNEQYFNQEEENEEEVKAYLDNVEQEFDINQKGKPLNKRLEREKEEGLIPQANLPFEMKHKINHEEAQMVQESTNKILWWFCDNCSKGILPLEQRFDCMECPNYCLCKKCNSLNIHEHKLKKFIVPEKCVPPKNEEITQTLEQMISCGDCSVLINKTDSYY